MAGGSPQGSQGPDPVAPAVRLYAGVDRVVFAPRGLPGVVVRRDGRWFSLRTDKVSPALPLPLRADLATFFVRDGHAWLLANDGSALAWPPDDAPETTPVRFRAAALPGRGDLVVGPNGAFLAWRGGAVVDHLAGDPSSWGAHAKALSAAAQSAPAAGTVTTVCSPDGRYLADVTDGASVEILDRKTGKRTAVAGDPGKLPRWASAHPVESVVAVTSGALEVFDLLERSTLFRWTFREGPVTSCAFSPDGRYLALLVGDRLVVHEHSARSFVRLPDLGLSAAGANPAMVFSPGGRFLAVCATSLCLLGWNEIVALLSHGTAVTPD